jgi:hypothetical protein
MTANSAQRATLTPDHMTVEDVLAWMASPEFSAACRETNARVEAGEKMSLEEVAASLGLPWAFFANCLGITILTQVPDALVRIEDGPSVPIS